jgi:hypothetical protein
MADTPTIRVRAVGDVLVPRVAEDGTPVVSTTKGRYVARDAQKRALPAGEAVPDTHYYRAEVAAGALALAPDPAPEVTP